MVDCYVGMGGNFADTFAIMSQVVRALKNEKEIQELKVSRLYRTSPVSIIPQAHYLNAVCRLSTQMSIEALWDLLQTLELKCGKRAKSKNAPRLIDLDLLFYGSLIATTNHYSVPHPRWHERLFVLIPLADLTTYVPLDPGCSIQQLIENFTSPIQQDITLIDTINWYETNATC